MPQVVLINGKDTSIPRQSSRLRLGHSGVQFEHDQRPSPEDALLLVLLHEVPGDSVGAFLAQPLHVHLIGPPLTRAVNYAQQALEFERGRTPFDRSIGVLTPAAPIIRA